MEPAALVVLAIPLAVFAFLVALTGRSKAARVASAWRTGAARLGLAFDKSAMEMRGAARGLAVTVRLDGEATSVLIDGGGAIPRDVVIRRAGGATGLSTGDEAFDAAVAVSGPPERAFALLGARERRDLASSVAIHGTVVEDGRLALRVPWALDEATSIVDLVQRAKALAQALAVEPTRERLVAIATSDPDPRVRARIVEWMASPAGDRVAFADVIGAALLGDDAAARKAVRRGLGADVTTLLEGFLESGPPDRRARALRVLEESTPAPSVLPLVLRHLESAIVPLRIEAIAIAGRWRHAPAAPSLAESTRHSDAAVAAASAAALGEMGAAAPEPALLAALARLEPIVKRAAAEALGKVGTAAAVEPLLAHAEGGLFVDGEVKRLARAAVLAIQARLGADGGRLALADAEGSAGRLGLPAGGELSNADTKKAPGT